MRGAATAGTGPTKRAPMSRGRGHDSTRPRVGGVVALFALLLWARRPAGGAGSAPPCRTAVPAAILVYVAKVMVSFPDDLLAKVDRTARLRGTTRSGLLADAVRRELERRDPEAMRAAVQELEALAARYGWPTSADIEAEKKERDERDMRR